MSKKGMMGLMTEDEEQLIQVGASRNRIFFFFMESGIKAGKQGDGTTASGKPVTSKSGVSPEETIQKNTFLRSDFCGSKLARVPRFAAVSIVDQLLADDLKELSTSAPAQAIAEPTDHPMRLSCLSWACEPNAAFVVACPVLLKSPTHTPPRPRHTSAVSCLRYGSTVDPRAVHLPRDHRQWARRKCQSWVLWEAGTFLRVISFCHFF